jgi:hypothetical protein
MKAIELRPQGDVARRMVQQARRKNTLRLFVQLARVAIAKLRERASDRGAPIARCCLAAERSICCACARADFAAGRFVRPQSQMSDRDTSSIVTRHCRPR